MDSALGGIDAQRGNLADVFFAFGVPGIVRGLHADPDAGAVAEQFAEPNHHGRRYRFALAQNIVEMLGGDAKKLRNLGFGPACRWNHILPQQSAGMGRAATRVTFGNTE
jgi:hypothetical protein